MSDVVARVDAGRQRLAQVETVDEATELLDEIDKVRAACRIIDAAPAQINAVTRLKVETRAKRADLIAAMEMLGLRIVYVFGDLTCNCHSDVRVREWISPAPGAGRRIATNGSGTPMALVRKDEQFPLDRLFGAPL